MRKFLCLVLAACVGCSGTLEETKGKLTVGVPRSVSSPERCQSLANRQLVWGGVAAGSAVLSGASGLTAIPAEGDIETVLGVSSLVIGGVAAGTAVVSQGLATQWSGECTK